MDDEIMQKLTATADLLASAAETLDRVLERLDAQQEALNAKVDRIVAAVEDKARQPGDLSRFQQQIAELEKANADLKGQAARLARKTLPATVSALLSKNVIDADERLDPAALDKALQVLSVEQRIAVKAEMARAGMLD
jgi:predicted RNase H-like nuclease (RuvC/YqgF family)